MEKLIYLRFIYIGCCYRLPFLISGEHAPLNELVDFIAAAQIAEEFEKESEGSLSSDEEKDQVKLSFKLY